MQSMRKPIPSTSFLLRRLSSVIAAVIRLQPKASNGMRNRVVILPRVAQSGESAAMLTMMLRFAGDQP